MYSKFESNIWIQFNYNKLIWYAPTKSKVAKNVDRELVEQIRLAVVVEDIATQTERQQTFGYLTIIVDDENDNNPVFKERVYKRSISENSPVGSVIANIAATDEVRPKRMNLYAKRLFFLSFIILG